MMIEKGIKQSKQPSDILLVVVSASETHVHVAVSVPLNTYSYTSDEGEITVLSNFMFFNEVMCDKLCTKFANIFLCIAKSLEFTWTRAAVNPN